MIYARGNYIRLRADNDDRGFSSLRVKKIVKHGDQVAIEVEKKGEKETEERQATQRATGRRGIMCVFKQNAGKL